MGVYIFIIGSVNDNTSNLHRSSLYCQLCLITIVWQLALLQVGTGDPGECTKCCRAGGVSVFVSRALGLYLILVIVARVLSEMYLNWTWVVKPCNCVS